MKIISRYGRDDLAYVYLAEFDSGKKTEFVESIQPPLTRDKKWVLIVSTLHGCPVGCSFCDAGRWYDGKLAKDEILEQIDFLVRTRFPDKKIATKKFKIQFARMGDPAFNMAVLDAIEEIPHRYDAPTFLPSISTVAPVGCDKFFSRLLDIASKKMTRPFQAQFSIHSTDQACRDKLIPIRKWSFEKIASYGKKIAEVNEKKVALNFVVAKDIPIDSRVLLNYFDPDSFIIKLTPVNPTLSAQENGIENMMDKSCSAPRVRQLIEDLQAHYEVIVSFGEAEENKIGSNCGQFVRSFVESGMESNQMYAYQPEKL